MKVLILLIATGCFLVVPAFSQLERGIKVNSEGHKKTKEKLALVIGNANYNDSIGKLKNPLNDVDSMSVYLKRLKFDVLKHKNLNLKETEKAVKDFQEKLKDYEIGFFFFAGHGAEVNGKNYLFPVDANPGSEEEAEKQCYPLDQLLEKMYASQTNANIIVLDACRSNPFKENWLNPGSAGLAKVEATNTLVALAAAPGSTAADGNGKNGVYTHCILKNIEKDRSINDIFSMVAGDVQTLTKGSQKPISFNSLPKLIFFTKKDGGAAAVIKPPSGIESLNGAIYEQSTSTDNLTFTVLPGKQLSFSGKIKSYLVSGKLKQSGNMNFQVIEGNVTGTLSFINENKLVTGNITIKESKLVCTVNLSKND